MIKPHGGKLVNKTLSKQEKNKLSNRTRKMQKIYLNMDELITLENIASGLFSPLEGFMNRVDYNSVLTNMRLKDGTLWSLPIVLGVSEEEAEKLTTNKDVGLYLKNDKKIYGVLHLTEKYKYDKRQEAQLIYKTTEEAHPGVQEVYKRGDVLLAGNISLLNEYKHNYFNKYRYKPSEVREIIKNNNWKTVVGFQTRNPIHRAHEYLQKCALEIVDGLFLNPLVGKTKPNDVPADIRIKSYEIILEKYYPEDRTLLAVFPASMFYAGPREAIFHAICRKNYGCTHFIVGRDHAGVGNYYDTYEAQKIFDQISTNDLEIEILKFEHAFYCKKCNNMASKKTCPHHKTDHIYLSGTKVRQLIRKGVRPPIEMTRKEVAEILIEKMSSYID